VSHAFHSPLMEPMIGEFKAAARELAVNPVTIPVISNVTGELAGDDFASADYWTQYIRAAVRFADSIRYANAAGASHFIEVGPGGGLTSSIEESLADVDVASVPLLRKDRPEPNSLMTGLAQAFVSGVGIDWRATLPGAGFVELPTYAFERRRFWLSADEAAVDAEGLGLAASEHALLGAVVDLPTSGGVVLTGRLSAQSQSWLNDHAVGGVVIFPGAGFVRLEPPNPDAGPLEIRDGRQDLRRVRVRVPAVHLSTADGEADPGLPRSARGHIVDVSAALPAAAV